MGVVYISTSGMPYYVCAKTWGWMLYGINWFVWHPWAFALLCPLLP